MAIYKKQRMWSEKDHSYNEETPTFQRGVIALRKRQQTGIIIPTTIKKPHTVVLTPLDTRGRTILKGGYAASLTKITDLNSKNASYAAGVSFSKLVEWRKEARVKDELVYVPSTKKLYITTRALNVASAGASTYTAAKLLEAIASGQLVELKQFVSTAPNWIPIHIVASTASNSASIGRFAYEVVGYD